MKKIFLFLLLFSSLCFSNENIVTINHKNFKEYAFVSKDSTYFLRYAYSDNYEVVNTTNNKVETRSIALHEALAFLLSRKAEPVLLYPRKIKSEA